LKEENERNRGEEGGEKVAERSVTALPLVPLVRVRSFGDAR